MKNNNLTKYPKRILSGLKLTDAKGIAKQAFNSDNIMSTVGGIAGGLNTVIESSIANGKIDTSKADNAIAAINAYEPSGGNLNAISSGYNTLTFNNGINAKDMTVSTGEGLANMGKAGLAGFTTGLQTGGIWGGITGLFGGLAASGGSWAGASIKSKNVARQKMREEDIAALSANIKTEAAIDEYLEDEYNNFMSNKAAYGGPIYNHQGDWSNGLTFINEGGTHEENPFDGVLMGFDQEGIPNLVEEGEIIYKDYVFSNRLKPTIKQLENWGFNTKYADWTFAKIVEDLQKTSAETPLDKISMDSLDDMMNTMMTLQEEIRMKKGLTGQNRLMKFGGNILSGENDLKKVPKIKMPENRVVSLISPKGEEELKRQSKLRITDPKQYLKERDAYYKNLKSTFSKDPNITFLDNLGMLSPTIDALGKTIYNIVKPVDTSNFVAEEANRQRAKANLNRINVQPKLEFIDENAFITPIINQGRATAKDIQNLGTTGADVMNRLALNAYNTQNAIGKGLIDVSNANFARQQQYDNTLANLQRANIRIDQAEFMLNDDIAKDVALGKIADAAAIENAENSRLQAIDSLSADINQDIADLTRQNIEWNMIAKNPVYSEYLAKMRNNAKYGGMLTKRGRRK